MLLRRRYDPGKTLHGPLTKIKTMTERPIVYGSPSRIHVGSTASLANVVINVYSGDVKIGDYTFFGPDVMLLTGSHDFRFTGRERQLAAPTSGRDIIIEEGVWVASRAVILGPCRIGANAVIGCGCVVDFDVPANTVVRQRQELIQEPIRFRGH